MEGLHQFLSFTFDSRLICLPYACPSPSHSLDLTSLLWANGRATSTSCLSHLLLTQLCLSVTHLTPRVGLPQPPPSLTRRSTSVFVRISEPDWLTCLLVYFLSHANLNSYCNHASGQTGLRWVDSSMRRHWNCNAWKDSMRADKLKAK